MVTQVAAYPRSAESFTRGVHIRRARVADAPELRRFYASLSDESRRRRFLGFTSGLSDRQLDRFCRHGFVATVPLGSAKRIVGHLSLEPIGPHIEEVAVAVADDWQRQGIGRSLYAAALHSAESRGIERLEATMFAYNAPIRRLLTGAGRRYQISSDELGSLNLTIDLVGPINARLTDPASCASDPPADGRSEKGSQLRVLDSRAAILRRAFCTRQRT